MKKIIYSLFVLFVLSSCDKETEIITQDSDIAIKPASYISKEDSYHGLPNSSAYITRLGYSNIINNTSSVHINGESVPFQKIGYSISIAKNLVVNEAGALLSDSEIYLVANSDTIAHVPYELIQVAEFKFHYYPN